MADALAPTADYDAAERSARIDAALRRLSVQKHGSDGLDFLHRTLTGITDDSRAVIPGSLFVAITGEKVDGHRHIGDAVQRGAVAAVVERVPTRDFPPIPIFRVDDSRRALAALSAEWFGRPAEALTLVGITGTVGKTSILSLLEEMLDSTAAMVGSLGSLGLRIGGREISETGYTAPDPLLLHEALREIADAGGRITIMEATSHALVQERLAGLNFSMGILTNLLPLEHQDYHGSFRGYVDAKRRFFDHLVPGAPLTYNADDRAVRRLVRDHDVERVGVGRSRTAAVRVEVESMQPGLTRMALNIRREIPRLNGGAVAPLRLPLEVRLLGRSNVSNVALAATSALMLGAEADRVAAAVEGITAPRRRMEVIHNGDFLVLDDTVGHPDSISAHFEVVEALAPKQVHIAFAIRGQRGRRINRESARSLAIWCERIRPASLVVTSSTEAADERNRVEEAERHAFLEVLSESGIPFSEQERLDQAVTAVLDNAEPGDAVLLLGAQGMDQGQVTAREWLRRARGLL